MRRCIPDEGDPEVRRFEARNFHPGRDRQVRHKSRRVRPRLCRPWHLGNLAAHVLLRVPSASNAGTLPEIPDTVRTPAAKSRRVHLAAASVERGISLACLSVRETACNKVTTEPRVAPCLGNYSSLDEYVAPRLPALHSRSAEYLQAWTRRDISTRIRATPSRWLAETPAVARRDSEPTIRMHDPAPLHQTPIAERSSRGARRSWRSAAAVRARRCTPYMEGGRRDSSRRLSAA